MPNHQGPGEARERLLRRTGAGESGGAGARAARGLRGDPRQGQRPARQARRANVSLPQGLRALRFRNFRLFFIGQGVSQIGSWLQMIATSWLVYHLSGSAFLLGLAAFALQIPFFLLAPLAGVFVDRLDRRGVLVATNWIAASQALAMFLVVALGVAQPWHFVAGNLVLGIVNAFNAPARQSILLELVGGRGDLPNAIALNSVMMNGARMPWFAREAFHGDWGALGILIGAAGLGAVSGMLYLAMRPSVRGLFRLIAWMSATAGGALVAFSLATTLWVALPALYLVGL